MFSAAKPMAGAMCTKVVGSSQKVCCPIHPGKQAAASSRKQQQAAASKQQPAFAPLKEWTNKDQRDTKNWTFSRRTALKQWNRSITKSCDDAKLELFSRRTASRYDFQKLIRLKPSTCMVIQEPNGNTWIWPTKASKTIQQITANLIGTATIATTPLKSFAQWYGLKSKESLRLWPLTVHTHTYIYI